MPDRFTLAALAVGAVPGLEVTGVRAIGGAGDGAFAAAVVTLADGREAVVRVPANAAARARLRAEVGALAALTAGVRSRLPFGVPTLIGAEDGVRPVAVTSWIRGGALHPDAVRADAPLASSLGTAIAAIHGLPTGIGEGRLPVREAAVARREAEELVQGLTRSGRLPAAVADRWSEAFAAPAMWQYRPRVVHGSLAPDELLIDGDVVSGVLGWSALHIGDPAADLAWALSLPARGAADAVFTTHGRATEADPWLRQRATLLAELELAKWLRFALGKNDDALVADATGMLTALEHRVNAARAGSLLGEPDAVLSVHDVERLLGDHEDRLSVASAAAHRDSSSASDEMRAGRMTRSAAT